MNSCRALTLLVLPSLFLTPKANLGCLDRVARSGTAETPALRQQLKVALSDYRAKGFDAAEFGPAGLPDPSEETIFNRGNELLLHHQVRGAVEAFSRGVKEYPRSARLSVGLGIALYALGDYARAVQELLRASGLQPEEPRPYFFLANAYTFASNVPYAEGMQVVARLQRLTEAHSENPQVLFYYALCLWKQERDRGNQENLKQVESLLKKSARLDPDFVGVHLQLGIFYQGEKRNEEAIQELRQAVKLNPNLATVHYRLGQLYTQFREKAQAEQEFQAFGRLNSSTSPTSDKEGRDIEKFLSSMKLPDGEPRAEPQAH